MSDRHEHEHHQDECTCIPEHRHEHSATCNHAHDHSHSHHGGCDCPDCAGESSHAATALVEQALRFSRVAAFSSSKSRSLATLEDRITQTLKEIAEQIAFDGVVLGHIKALLHYNNESISFSLTQVDKIDVQHFAGVSEQNSLTLNVISALPSNYDLEAAWQRLMEIL